MAEVKLGSKHECPSCSTKFYDLGKPKSVCPGCGAEAAADGEESATSQKSPEPQDGGPDSQGEEE